MKLFQHGGDIYKFAKDLDCKVDEIIDLSSNINFLKPTLSFDFNTLKIDNYPNYNSLYNSLASLYKIQNTQLEIFNGATSAIFSFFHSISNINCNIYSPAYLEYKKASSIFNKQLNIINRFININQNVIPNSIVIFVNPSTPDGTFYNIEDMLEYWDKQNCIVLVDESFLDFTNYKSAIEYINRYKNLYILKSLTKFYSCAGVRVGVIISSKQNIDKLKVYEPLWKISQFDSVYIQEVLKDKNFSHITKVTNIVNKEYLYKILTNSSLFKNFIVSEANFVLAQLDKLTAKEFQQKLKIYKIMVRDCSNFDFLDEKYVRIAIKNLDSLKLFEKAIKKIEEVV